MYIAGNKLDHLVFGQHCASKYLHLSSEVTKIFFFSSRVCYRGALLLNVISQSLLHNEYFIMQMPEKKSNTCMIAYHAILSLEFGYMHLKPFTS